MAPVRSMEYMRQRREGSGLKLYSRSSASSVPSSSAQSAVSPDLHESIGAEPAIASVWYAHCPAARQGSSAFLRVKRASRTTVPSSGVETGPSHSSDSSLASHISSPSGRMHSDSKPYVMRVFWKIGGSSISRRRRPSAASCSLTVLCTSSAAQNVPRRGSRAMPSTSLPPSMGHLSVMSMPEGTPSGVVLTAISYTAGRQSVAAQYTPLDTKVSELSDAGSAGRFSSHTGVSVIAAAVRGVASAKWSMLRFCMADKIPYPPQFGKGFVVQRAG